MNNSPPDTAMRLADGDDSLQRLSLEGTSQAVNPPIGSISLNANAPIKLLRGLRAVAYSPKVARRGVVFELFSEGEADVVSAPRPASV